MAQFRIRGKLPTGQPIIVRASADNPYQAAFNAGKEIEAAGHNLAQISDLAIRKLDKSKSSVYVGQVPSGKPRGKKPATAPAAPAAATPAKPATAPVKK